MPYGLKELFKKYEWYLFWNIVYDTNELVTLNAVSKTTEHHDFIMILAVFYKLCVVILQNFPWFSYSLTYSSAKCFDLAKTYIWRDLVCWVTQYGILQGLDIHT